MSSYFQHRSRLGGACTAALSTAFVAGLSATSHAQVTFSQRSLASFGVIGVDITPNAFKILDLDGDGDMDVLYGAQLSSVDDADGLRWFQSNGAATPTFTNRAIVQRSFQFDSFAAIAAADLNADNAVDIVGAYEISGQNNPLLQIFGSNGSPTPTFSVNTAPGATLESIPPGTPVASTLSVDTVLIADINGDQQPDIISASSDTGEFNWYWNSGGLTPSFLKRPIDTGVALGNVKGFINGGSIQAAELTGDGFVDLLLGVDGELRLYESDGASPFPNFTEVRSWTIPGSVQAKVVDMDGDGNPDIAFATSDGFAAGVLGVLYSDGATPPAFSRADIATDGPFSSLEVGDINLDGAPDILTVRNNGNSGTNGLRWYENDADTGQFTPHPITIPAAAQNPATALGDIDNDGDLDVIYHIEGTPSFSIFENNLDPTAPVFTVQPQSQSVAHDDTVVFAADADFATDYQWFFDPSGDEPNARISGATSRTLSIQARASGVYTCVASNAFGDTTSDPAFLPVGPPNCPQDLDLSGVADFFDVLLFLNQIDQGCPTE